MPFNFGGVANAAANMGRKLAPGGDMQKPQGIGPSPQMGGGMQGMLSKFGNSGGAPRPMPPPPPQMLQNGPSRGGMMGAPQGGMMMRPPMQGPPPMNPSAQGPMQRMGPPPPPMMGQGGPPPDYRARGEAAGQDMSWMDRAGALQGPPQGGGMGPSPAGLGNIQSRIAMLMRNRAMQQQQPQY